MSKGREHLKHFWSYVGYGVGACILLAIPLIAIDWLLENLPFLGTLLEEAKKIGTPGVGLVVGLVAAVLGLALVGWILRRFLWDSLSRMPVIGTIMTSGQQFAEAVSSLDRTSRELVVWVQFLRYRSLGILMSLTQDEDGTEYASVFLLSGAGQFQGNQICSVLFSDLTFPGWMVNEAIVFSSSGGAVVPESVEADAATT